MALDSTDQISTGPGLTALPENAAGRTNAQVRMIAYDARALLEAEVRENRGAGADIARQKLARLESIISGLDNADPVMTASPALETEISAIAGEARSDRADETQQQIWQGMSAIAGSMSADAVTPGAQSFGQGLLATWDSFSKTIKGEEQTEEQRRAAELAEREAFVDAQIHAAPPTIQNDARPIDRATRHAMAETLARYGLSDESFASFRVRSESPSGTVPEEHGRMARQETAAGVVRTGREGGVNI